MERSADDRADVAGGMADAEELRELILTQHTRLEALRRDAESLDVMVSALQSLLDLGDEVDPFKRVFEVLGPLFGFSAALVLVGDVEGAAPEENAAGAAPEETAAGAAPAMLRCVVATESAVVGIRWQDEAMADKARTGRVIATVGGPQQQSWPPQAQAAGLSPEQPALYLPMGAHDQRGLMVLLRPVGAEGFDRRDVAMARRLTLLASQAFATRLAEEARKDRRHLRRLTTELRTDRDELARRANHDELTGLTNRAYFRQCTAEAIARTPPGEQLAMLFIDLDGFKQVNDNYGHGFGDQLLVAVARRLREYSRRDDVIARVSGDEFMMLIDPLPSVTELLASISRNMADFRRPFDLDERQVLVSASVGIALYPDHGITHDELRRNADIAMYQAKRRARGSTVVYEPSMGDAASAELDGEQRLRRAVAERRFCAVLQPKIDVTAGRICGFEVLARQVDELGQVGASADFIGIANRTGLLDEITALVIDDAMGDIAGMDAVFGSRTTFSINISTAQATDPSLLASLLGQLGTTMYASRFVLEITEDALLQQEVFERKVEPLLRQAGVAVSIDDFGTGYASLSRLLSVTADEIKIDRSFITDIQLRPRSQVVVGALEMIAAELGAVVVAEGIETAAELAYLRAHTQVQVGQGFVFARPARASTLMAGADELRRHVAAACDAAP